MLKEPRQHLGFEVGADKKLADWQQITSYFEHLSQSERMLLEEYGRSTEDRPMLVATISSPENLAQLEKYQQIQARLADPRTLTDAEAEQLVQEGKTIVLITCSIHATEVGAAQMSMELAYELLTRNDDDVQEILENVIFLLVPSLNPDGLDLVVNWYRKTLDTPAEGTMPPELYQKYTGHDNNRDWFMLTQVENRNTVLKIHNVWHPHIVHDQHQQGSNGVRFVLPPFIDPYDPNVDPILQQEIAWLGQSMAAALTNKGMTGVATNVIYDAYSPSRAYQHYHGGVRILSEAASVRIATPIKLKKTDLVARRNLDPRQSTWNHPLVWEGGDWRLRDIVEYDKTVAFACLQHAAKYRKDWVRNFYYIHKKAVERTDAPQAFVIPQVQRDPYTAAELLEVLQLGLVKVEKAQSSFCADGLEFRAGDLIIRAAQPYGAYAKTLLERQHYPDLRLYPGGPPKRPYDITAHSLPLQMNVSCIAVKEKPEVDTVSVEKVTPTDFISIFAANTVPEGNWSYIRPESNHSAKLVNQLLKDNVSVYRLVEEWNGLPAGTFIVPQQLDETVAGIGGTVGQPPRCCLAGLRKPRIALYKSFVPGADEGWTRFILEQYDFDFVNITTHDIRGGKLDQFDAVILPSHWPQALERGLPDNYPREYRGGLDELAAEQLSRFVKRGGTLLSFDAACDWAIEKMWLPVENSVRDLPSEEFYIPGSFLTLLIDNRHPVAYGMEREAVILFLRSPAFTVKDSSAVVIGRYPNHNLLQSGWILGEEHLHGKAGLVEIPLGKGRIILYGMRPQFRAQARGTYRLFFNGLYLSAMES